MKIYRKIRFYFMVITMLLVFGSAATPVWSSDHDESKQVTIPIEDARLKFEINATDLDGGIQVFLDADPWKSMKIFDPNGNLLFKTTARGSVGRLGGTELFLESGEPEFKDLPLEDLLELFPEGEYRFSGIGVEGEKLVGSAMLTHNIADGPKLVYPLEGDGLQDPDNTTVMWQAVGDANNSPIIAYQVLVVAPESNFDAIPKISLDIMMPATATSVKVPAGFLRPDTNYEWEVLAIEESGNQTLSSSFFKTSP